MNRQSILARPMNRRAFAVAASTVSLAALTPRTFAQGTPEASPAASPIAAGVQPDGTWSFPDGHGSTVTLPEMPKRIVAYSNAAAALFDYGIECVGIWGPQKRADGTPDPQTGDLDLSKLESLGQEYQEFDIEKLVGLNPDLLVGVTYDPSNPDDVWYLAPDSMDKIRSIAPVVTASVVRQSVTETIGTFETLAAALGAAMSADTVTAAKADFMAASDEVKAAAAAKPGLSVLVVSGGPDNIYIAAPAVAPDLTYFRELGVDVIEPKDQANYWETLSWEQANLYPADMILNDVRSTWFTIEQMYEQPSFANLPAAKAKQVYNWYTEYVFSHKGFTPVLQELAKDINESNADLV